MNDNKSISSVFEIFKNSENNIIFFGTVVQEKPHCRIKYVEKIMRVEMGLFQ